MIAIILQNIYVLCKVEEDFQFHSWMFNEFLKKIQLLCLKNITCVHKFKCIMYEWTQSSLSKYNSICVYNAWRMTNFW